MKPDDVNVTNLGEGGAYGSDGDISPEIFEERVLPNQGRVRAAETREHHESLCGTSRACASK